MAKSIARQAIGGRAGIARRQIAGKFGQADVGIAYVYPQGSFTFRASKPGYWKFVLTGAGYSDATGAYSEYTRYLSPADSVALAVGYFANLVDTTATFPDGKVVTAGQASSGTAGVASGGDVNLNGSTGSSDGLGTGGGAGNGGLGLPGVPAMLPFRGFSCTSGNSIGPGCAAGAGRAGAGQIIVVFVRD